MKSRDVILDRLRVTLADGNDVARRAAVDERLRARHPNTVPAVARTDKGDRATTFMARLEATGATVTRLVEPDEVPEAVAGYLRQHNLAPDNVVIAPHPQLDALPWDRVPQIFTTHGRAEAHHSVGISVADLGLVETGTLCFASSRHSPTTLHFVPETEIAVVQASALVGGIEEVWAYLRAKGRGGALPRAVNFVTGPSRTADIELTLTMGAHGPRNLHVLLVGKTS